MNSSALESRDHGLEITTLHVPHLSASEVVIHYEEVLYQLRAPLPLPLPLPVLSLK